MKNNGKAFSKALFKDNMKRFLPISMAAFLICFLSGPFMLISRRELVTSYTLSNLLSNMNFGLVFAELALPVAAAAAVFSYLARTNSVNAMHSLPFSRKTLFVTNSVSGLVLSELPLVLTAVCLEILKLSGILKYEVPRNVYPSVENVSGAADAGVLFTFAAVMKWLFVASVISVFVFAMCTLGAVISGTSVISFLTGCSLNALIPVMYLGIFAYASTYLYGFNDTFNEQVVSRMHPMLYYTINSIYVGEGSAPAKDITAGLIFLLIAAAIFALAYFAYTRRPNEKTGDSYVFSWVRVSIGVILTVLGSSFVGLVFSESFGIWGFILGGIISFLIAHMIVEGTVRIFGKGILKPLLISVLAVALLLCIFIFDVFGFAKRVPKVEKISRAEFSCGGFSEGRRFSITDDADLEKLTAFHRDIAENRYDYRDEIWEEEGKGWVASGLNIYYTLNSGRTVNREYYLPVSVLKSCGLFEEAAAKCDTVERFQKLKVVDPADYHMFISIYGWGDAESMLMYEQGAGFEDYVATLPASERSRLFNALADDVAAVSPADLWDIDYTKTTCYISIEREAELTDQDRPGGVDRWGTSTITEEFVSKSSFLGNEPPTFLERYTFELSEKFEKTNALLGEFLEDYLDSFK